MDGNAPTNCKSDDHAAQQLLTNELVSPDSQRGDSRTDLICIIGSSNDKRVENKCLQLLLQLHAFSLLPHWTSQRTAVGEEKKGGGKWTVAVLRIDGSVSPLARSLTTRSVAGQIKESEKSVAVFGKPLCQAHWQN